MKSCVVIAPPSGLAGFNGVFWLLRIGIDTFYFRHSDWPKGPLFTVGHVLLTSLFCALAATYVAVIFYHVLPPIPPLQFGEFML